VAVDIMRRASGGRATWCSSAIRAGDLRLRGADVHTYLQARDVVDSEWTLDVNWRSDKVAPGL